MATSSAALRFAARTEGDTIDDGEQEANDPTRGRAVDDPRRAPQDPVERDERRDPERVAPKRRCLGGALVATSPATTPRPTVTATSVVATSADPTRCFLGLTSS